MIRELSSEAVATAVNTFVSSTSDDATIGSDELTTTRAQAEWSSPDGWHPGPKKAQVE
ncbi:hypothetical protein [Microbacterium sp. R86528]|uniref:hypothetical protein n=1 Tax=Microbacterium sp. R86528 TaxID=3093864 RepID=UPI0037CCB1D0